MAILIPVVVGGLLCWAGWSILSDAEAPLEDKAWGGFLFGVGLLFVFGATGYAVTAG